MDKIDIVVPVHNAVEHLRVCIDAIARTVSDYRLILVDDFSDNDTKAYLQEVIRWRNDTKLVQHGKQVWYTRSANSGLCLVRTPWAMLLNSDCIPRAGWLEELFAVRDLAIFETHEKIGIVGAHLARDPAYPRYQNVKHPGYVTGHAWLCNMEALRDVAAKRGTPGRYFDERSQHLIHISSDRELCWELNRYGWGTMRSCNSEVDHAGGMSWRRKDTGEHDLQTVGQLRLVDVD